MNKKTKHIIVIAVLTVCMIFGLSRFKVQSVSDYKKEQQQTAKALKIQTTTSDGELTSSSGEKASSGKNASKKHSSKTKKPPKKDATDSEKASTNPSKEGAKKDAKKDTNNHTNKDTNKASKHKKKTKTDTSTPRKKKSNEKDPEDSFGKKEKESPSSDEKEINCTISIICPVLSEDPSQMRQAYRSYIPASGVLLETSTVTIKEGDSVFDLLKAVCQAKGIALDAEYSSLYSGSYVRGIGHLYERCAGDMSGWLYKVNGVIPQKGASNYKLKDNDNVVWGYTVNGRGM